jgi:hypothetical protein
MKRLLLIAVIFSSFCSFGQTIDHIVFDYDVAGNQIKRYVIDITPGRNGVIKGKDLDSLVENDLIESDLYKDIRYYPNPVVEELFVKWDNSINLVENIELYNIGGQLMKSFKTSIDSNERTVSFINYPSGMYTLVLNYSNGGRKTLKIVKN